MARKRTSSKRPVRKAAAGKATAAKAGWGHAEPAAAPRHGRASAVVDTRVVYCGDCFDQLRKLPDGCVDLVYIDPPFNSNRNYEVFWGETKETRAFEDRHASTQAYIEYMRPRCVELLHRPWRQAVGSRRRSQAPYTAGDMNRNVERRSCRLALVLGTEGK